MLRVWTERRIGLVGRFEIGELSTKWNWLVGEYDNPTKDIKVLHWTLGGPYFEEYSKTEFSEEWSKEFKSMTFCKQME